MATVEGMAIEGSTSSRGVASGAAGSNEVPRLWASIVSVLGAVAVHLFLQAGDLIAFPGRPLSGLRTMYWHDQLGYMSMVANVINGRPADLEPDTLTGVNYYPHFYYSVVGMVGKAFQLSAVQSWNLTALLLQAVMVAVLATVAVIVTKRAWVAWLAPLPFLMGTLSWLTVGGWYTHVGGSHAVLWGPFGVLFSLNGETAGLAVLVMAGALTVCSLAEGLPVAGKRSMRICAAIMVGGIASFQTYSFLTGVYFFVAILAVLGLLRRRSWVYWLASVGLVALTFVAGPSVSAHFGQLPTLVFGLLCGLPGLWALLRLEQFRWVGYGLITGLAAMPEIVTTALGKIRGDPFLSYRTVSNVDLGVAHRVTLVAVLPVVIPLLAGLAVAYVRRNRLVAALCLGSLAAFFMVSVNDLWGANAEPYRMWIDGFLLCSVAVLLAWLSSFSRLGERQGVAESGPRSQSHWYAQLALQMFGGISLVALLVSLPDFVLYRADGNVEQKWNSASPESSAVAELGREAQAQPGGGLLVTDTCVDPRTTKVLSGVPVAYYHVGMAWPQDREAIQNVMSERDQGSLAVGQAVAAGVRFVLTKTPCESDWSGKYADKLSEIKSLEVGDERFTLWRLSQ